MDIIEFLSKHWFMYHKIEDEFLEIEKIIPVDLQNNNSFSYSYMKLLGSICIEFNECFRNFTSCFELNYNSPNQYKFFINEKFPEFINIEITFYKLGCEIQYFKPFENWVGDNKLWWWEINNAVKHSRNNIEVDQIKENYKLVNQNCILTALSGLYQLNIYFYSVIERNSTSFEVLLVPPHNSKIFNFSH